MKDGKRNTRITPHDEEDDWDWRSDNYKIQKEMEENAQIKKEIIEETLDDFMEDDNGSEEESNSKEESSKEGSKEESSKEENGKERWRKV